MTGHSRLAPSSADRWVQCPASVQLSERFPELVEHPSAAEGDAAHWVAYSMLKTHVPQLGDITPNGLSVTEEMLEGGKLWANTIFAICNPHGGLSRVRLEQREQMPSIHPECHGTPDAVIDLAELVGEVHVPDYKFGHGEVEEFENWQTVLYSRGVLDRLGFDGHMEQHLTLVFTIVQPRCYTSKGPVRQWRVKAAELRGMWNRLHAAADEALGDDPTYRAGPHCEHCPGRRACPALKRIGGAAMDYAGSGMPVELPPEWLGLELQQVERLHGLLGARLEALREQAEFHIRNGGAVPLYALQPGQGSTKWRAEPEELFGLGDLLGVDLRKPAAPITPTQAKTAFKKKGLDGSVIDAYSERVPGSLKLVPVNASQARRIFSA